MTSAVVVFMVFVMLVGLVVVIVVVVAMPTMVTMTAVMALVTIPGVGTDGRAASTTDAGTDQLPRVAAHALADGGPTQGADGTTQGGFILVALVGRGRATGCPPDCRADQGAGITPQLLADHGARDPADTPT